MNGGQEAHGHLALGVRAQEGQAAVTAQLGLALDQVVRVVDRRGHELGRFVAGLAEHQALVATVFAFHVHDPGRYGVLAFDDAGRASSIEEKKTALAQKMRTSRAALNRLLDAEDTSLTL